MSTNRKRAWRAVALTVALAGVALAAGACSSDRPVVPSSPASATRPSSADQNRAAVEHEVAVWAIANGYTGLSPVSLRPITTTMTG